MSRLNLSHTIYMNVWPNDEGKCVTKFVVNSSQSLDAVAIGWSRPSGF